MIDSTAASVRLSNKNAVGIVEQLVEQYEKYKAMPIEEVSDFDLHLLYYTIFNKVSVVLTSKVEDNYILTDDDSTEEKLNKLGKILNELTVLSEKGIEKVSSLEIESVVADDTGIPIGKIQAQEKDRLLGIETKLHERVKGQDKAYSNAV